jgi:hypothetical protein
MPDRGESRIGAVFAVAGSASLLAGTLLHPLQADPNDPVAAFAEYAADRLWVTSHLLQLAGVALIVAALLVLARRLESASAPPPHAATDTPSSPASPRNAARAAQNAPPEIPALTASSPPRPTAPSAAGGTAWSRIAAGGAVASLAVAAALQAVDGIALKAMVDTWAAAPLAQKETTFLAAYAVRQVEIGLASMGSLLFGLTATAYGVALLLHPAYPRWLGALAIAAGVPTTAAGIAIAYTGFSGLAMTLNMPASLALLVWMLALAAHMWRRPTALPAPPSA